MKRRAVSVDNRVLIRGNGTYLRRVRVAIDEAVRTGASAFSHHDEDDDSAVTTIMCERDKRSIGFKSKRTK